jgi:hypothetical protein
MTPKKFYIIWLHSAIYRVDNAACGRAWVCLQETTTLAYYATIDIKMFDSAQQPKLINL